MKNASRWIINYIGTILLLGLFAVGALVLMNVGVRVYNNVVTTNNDNYTLRTSLNYIATKVRSADVKGAVSVVDFGDGKALCLEENTAEDIYKTYIYSYNGKLCEVTESEGFPVEPDYGFDILDIKDFDVSGGGNMLRFSIQNAASETEELVLTLRTGGAE